jgi:phosphatidylserine decarboxylase
MSRKLIKPYIRFYQINTDEAEFQIHEYPTLTAFFSRTLKPGCRPICPTGVASPVDGTVSEFGAIQNDTLIQAKGRTYTLSALLGSRTEAQQFECGHYITLYLSPKDYHRIHMPLDGTLSRWRFIPGTLYPVNLTGVGCIPGLFAKNERLVTFAETTYGKMAIVKVGATIVGSIQTEYGPTFQNPWQRRKIRTLEGAARIRLKRGDEVGRFEFGSTVILVFERDMIQGFTVDKGASVRMGQSIATLVEETNES